ncbi:MAG: C40 family peptidase [Saprospiraceae bacterium]
MLRKLYRTSFFVFCTLCGLLYMMACRSEGQLVDRAESANSYIGQLQQQHIPDRRVARFDVDATGREHLVLKGETTHPALRDSLVQWLNEQGWVFTDSILVLPDVALGDSTFALTRHAVANLRSEKGHSQELATQVLLGTPIQLLKRQGEWFMVQCPDDYIAWIHEGEIARITHADLTQWQQSDRVVVVVDVATAQSRPDPASLPVGDVVKGGWFVRDGVEGTYTRVVYPDGRLAYLPTSYLQPVGEWLEGITFSFDRVRQTAFQYLGRPYLWGGTSPKGMDCSGFTKTVYWQQGLILPRDASQQVHAGEEVIFDAQLNGILPGDFLFFGGFREDGSEKITHVGIYLGEGDFIHSGSDNGANAIQNLLPDREGFAPHRRAALLHARRMLPNMPGVRALSNHPWYW